MRGPQKLRVSRIFCVQSAESAQNLRLKKTIRAGKSGHSGQQVSSSSMSHRYLSHETAVAVKANQLQRCDDDRTALDLREALRPCAPVKFEQNSKLRKATSMNTTSINGSLHSRKISPSSGDSTAWSSKIVCERLLPSHLPAQLSCSAQQPPDMTSRFFGYGYELTRAF